MTDYNQRDSVPSTPPEDGPPNLAGIRMFEVRLYCGCGSSDHWRDDVSLGELVDLLTTPATRGCPNGCICELTGEPLSLDLTA